MALKWFLFWRMFTNLLTAPVRWWEGRVTAKRQHQLALAQLQMQAATQPVAEMSQALVSVVDKLAASQAESAKVLQKWIEGFTVHQQPASQAPPSDYQEYERETRRQMEEAGMPSNANPLETMQWLAQTLDTD